MSGRWVEISPELLERIRARPDALAEVRMAGMALPVPTGAADALVKLLDPARLQALAGQLSADDQAALLEQAASMRTAVAGEPNRDQKPDPEGVRSCLNLGKAWHGIHFLMCETADEAPVPLGNAVLGGSEVGPDEGYGPIRFLTPDEVVAVANAIGDLEEAHLRRRLIPEALVDAQVYPGGWDAEDSLEWLMSSFAELREFYARAREGGRAVLLCVV